MEILSYSLILPLAYGINEMLKKFGMPSKYAGLVNIAIGGIIGVVIEMSVTGLILGIYAGLATGGVYSSVKKIV